MDKEAGFELIEKMRTIAAAHNASVAQVAIAWLLAGPGASSVVICGLPT
jgi:aryl-alcohol dehydrogenase-like predicted oxidoreductase